MRDYRELTVWQEAMKLVEAVYLAIKRLPVEERFALADQMRRAAVSIPSNIAEGHDRHSNKEFRRFLLIAKGSAAELETQLILCARLAYLDEIETNRLLTQSTQLRIKLFRLIQKCEN